MTGAQLVPPPSAMRSIAVTGGKGGVGKTTLAANLAIAMARLGIKVGILDADLGLANVDVMFRLSPRYTLKHVLTGEKAIEEIIMEGPQGVYVIPASSGVQSLANLPTANRKKLISEFGRLSDMIDVLVIDTPAGIGDNVMSFVLTADEILVVTTPDPTAYTDAYALIKVISQHRTRRINLLVNMVRSSSEAREVADILKSVTKRFRLNVRDISFVGYLPYEAKFRHALRVRVPFILEYPESRGAKSIQLLAKKLQSMLTRKSSAGDFLTGVHMMLDA